MVITKTMIRLKAIATITVLACAVAVTNTTAFVDAQLGIDGFPEECLESLNQMAPCFSRNPECSICAPGDGLSGFLENFQPPLPPIDPQKEGDGGGDDGRRRQQRQQQQHHRQHRFLQQLRNPSSRVLQQSAVPSDMPSTIPSSSASPSDMPSIVPSQAPTTLPDGLEVPAEETITLSPDGTVPCPYVEDPICPVVTCCFECLGEIIELYKCWLDFRWESSDAALTAITQCPFLYEADTCANPAGDESASDFPTITNSNNTNNNSQ